MSVFDFFKFRLSSRSSERAIDLQQLEDRTLFDAFPLVDPALAITPAETDGMLFQVANELATDQADVTRELLIIDAGVSDAGSLVADWQGRGETYDVVVLESGRSGVEQVTELLDGYDALDALHIVSHGQDAGFQLGSDWVTLESIARFQGAIESWGDAISLDGDILLYGCNLSGSEAGIELVEEIAQLTDADVAASDDVTGHERLNGDWDLEFAVGVIEAAVPFSGELQSTWRSQLGPPIQEFFVPMRESEIYDALVDIYTAATVDPDIETVIGITATRDNTIITYDHHEDGYEADIAAPVQASTQVWGDGNPANGSAPGLVGDIINAGDIVILQNLVPEFPGAVNYFDGSDRFVTDQLVAATRAGWSPTPGTVLAGTVEVTDTSRWGTSYEIPIGEDTANVFAQYEYTGLYVMAAVDGTVVDIDFDGDGTVDVMTTLNQGDSYHVDGGVLQGATVESTEPVQVDLITGDRASLVDSRWYLLRPTAEWSNAYINPVGTTAATDPATIVFYNPNATDITVDVETQGGTVPVLVPAGDSGVYVMPAPVGGEVSGAYVTSQGGEDFYAVMTMDSDAAHTAYDWGFSLLPEQGLTPMVVAGWAPGSEDLSVNGSPVWITATSATDLYIDFDGDPSTGSLVDPFGNRYDELRSVNALESERVFDSSDNDQSGLRVYTVDGTVLASAWGLDPDIGGPGLPYLDLGTIVLPFPVPTVTKVAALSNDVSANGLFDPGDTIVWTITITNNDGFDMTGVVSFDDVPSNTTYVANSTTVNGAGVADDSVGATIMPMDEGGLATADIGPGGTTIITFETTLNLPLPVYTMVENTVLVSSNLGTTGASVELPINLAPNLAVAKDDGGISTTPGGSVIYTIDYENLGTNNATGVVLTETLPANSSFDAANSTTGWIETGPGTGVFEYTVGGLNVGANGSVMFAVLVDDPLAAGVTQISNSVSIADDGSSGTDSDLTDNSSTDTTPVTAAPDLVVTKDDGAISVAAGASVVYTINYSNTGSQGATGVVVTESLPVGATFDAANSTAGWIESPVGSGTYEFTVGSLASGSGGSLAFAVLVDDPVAAGVNQLVNNVAIADDGTNGTDEDPSDNTDSDTDSLVAAPDLYVTKDDSQTVVAAGGSAVYAISYGNDGSQDATGVVLTETLPAGVTFDAANSSAGWNETAPGSGVFTLSIGSLASGASSSVNFAVTINDPQAAGVDQIVNNVSIADDGANGADEDVSDNSDSDTDTVTAAPDLFVTKDDGNGAVAAGDSVSYTINYGNDGTQGATGVVLTETLPANAAFDAANSTAGWTETAPGSGVFTWSIGALASGASGSVTFAVIVDDPQAAGVDQLINTVSIADDGANGTDEDGSDNSDGDTDALTAAPDLFITKDDGLMVVAAGQGVVYAINYGNDGSQDATGVVITETLPANAMFDAANSTSGWTETAPGSGIYTFSIGALASGASGNVNFAVIVDDPQAAGVTQLVNSVAIADDGANGVDEDPSDNSDNDTDSLTAAPDLFITKDDSLTVVTAGADVIYSINYGNDGSQDATGVVITETLPIGATFDAANSTAGWAETAPGSGVYTFNVGALASGASGSVNFAVSVNDPQAAGVDQLVNNVSIADDGANGTDEDLSDNDDNDVDTLTAAPDLFVTKDDGASVVAAGDLLVYTINYGNDGTQGATGVVLTETLPANATFAAANSTAGWTETAPGSGVFTFSVGSLAAGASGSVDFAVIVDDPQNAGVEQLVNNVAIADDGSNGADEDPSDNSDADTDTVTAAPDLFITKDDGQSVVSAGDRLVYTINYGNDGSQDATGVVITETLPSNAAFDAANSTAGWTETAPGSGVFTFSVGALASGSSGSVAFAVIVDSAQAANVDQLVNNVSIMDDGANGTDEDLSDNTDVDTDGLVAAPDLVIVKDDGNTVVAAGDSLIYTINYSNAGSQNATGVVITETLPTGATFDAANSTAGWIETAPGSGVYTFSVGALNVGASGSVAFAVTVDDPQSAGIDQLVNNVSIADDGSQGADENPANNSDTDTDVLTAAPDLFIAKDDGATVVAAGDSLSYTINYGNDGTQGATGVVITEVLPTGATFDAAGSTAGWTETASGSGIYTLSVGGLASGASGSVTFAVTVDDPQAAGVDQLINNVSITDDGSNGADEDASDNADSDTDTLNAAPDLFVTKDDGLMIVAAGSSAVYTINYGNDGTQGATGVTLTETLPSNASFDPANSTAGWTETAPGSGIYTFSIGALAAGAGGSVDFAVMVDDPQAAGVDQLVNHVSIADDGSNGVDEDPSDNSDGDTDALTAAPDLFITKTDGLTAVTAGANLIYVINYGNDGSQDATGVLISETLPTGVTFDAANSTPGWTETAPGSGVFTFSVGALASGDGGTISFAVTVNDPQEAGVEQLVNSVTIADDGLNGADEDLSDNSDSDIDTLLAAPDLFIVKDDGETVVAAGDSVIYTINYGNDGTQGATGVVITETLPVGATFDAANSSAGWTETAPGSGTFTFNVGGLASGASGSVAFAVLVDDPQDAGVDQLINNVSIADDGANGADEDPSDNSDDDVDTLTAAPDLFISKDDGATVVTVGNSVVYTINYGNDGTQGATGVVITETLPAGATFDAANSTAGWVETAPGSGTYQFTVGGLASGLSGSVTFAVVVDDPLAAGIDDLVNNVAIADDGTNGPDEDPSDNSDVDTDVIDAVPDLFVTKDDGLTEVNPGNVVTYTINYGNIGDQGATGVVLTEALPAGSAFNAAGSTAGWTETAPGSGLFQFAVGSLAADATGSVTFSVVVDDPIAAGIDQLINNVTIADDGTNGTDSDLTNNSDDDIDVVIAGPDLFVTKDDSDTLVTTGDTVVYVINYGNTGSQDATGVVLTETLPVGSTFDAANSTAGWTETAPGSGVFEFNVGALAVNATGSVNFAVTVNDPQDAGVDNLVNTVAIADDGANGPDENLADNSDTDSDVLDATPDLYISKDDGQAVVVVGDVVIYTIDYGNDGNQGATGVVITETVPVGSAFDAANSTAGWTETAPGSGVFEFNVGSLPADTMGSVAFAVVVDNPIAAGIDDLVNNVSIADDGANGVDPDLSDNSATDVDVIDAEPDLFVNKDDGVGVVTVGDLVIYTINYGNDGSQGATGVVLTETLPAGSSFDAANSTAGWTETSPGSGVFQFDIGALPSGTSASVAFAVIVDNPVAAGIDQLINNVTISDDGTNGPDEDPSDNMDSDVDTLNANPELSITKDDGIGTLNAGDGTAYTINYANTGSQGATGVVLTETLPTGTTFDAANSSAGWVETAPGSGLFQFTIPSLVAGGSGSVQFAVVVDNPLAAGIDQLINTVTISDDGTNGPEADFSDNTATDTDGVVAAPDLYVSKSDGDASVTPGGLAIYTISYGNDGTQGATGVTLFELLPANTVFDPTNSSPGWTESFPGEYELAIGDLASGETGTATFAVIVNSGIPSGVPAIENLVQIVDDGANGLDEDDEDNRGFDDTPLITAPDVMVTKTDGGITASPGDTVVYTLTYANVGNVGTANVVVTEFLPNNSTYDAASSTIGWTEVSPGVFEFSIDTLAAGESGTIDFAVIVDDPLTPGVTQLVNNATIVDDGVSGADANPNNNDAMDSTPLVAGPDLYVLKDDGQTVVRPGDALVYTINYGNNGTRGATGVVLTETLPVGATFDAANSTAGWVETAVGSGLFELTVGPLLVGATGSADFAVVLDDPFAAGIDDLVNNVSITDDGANGADENLADNNASDTDIVNAAPNLFITKDDGQTVAQAGDQLVYTINYGNNGDQDATGVILTETLPAGTTFDAANSSAGWMQVSTGVYRLTLGALAVGETGSVTFTVNVDNPVAAGLNQLVNNASIADDGTNGPESNSGDNNAIDTDTLNAAPDLWVTKDDGGATVTPGGAIIWSIQYGNDGTQDATDVVLTETLPANATFNATDSDSRWSETAPGSGVYELQLGALAAGQMNAVAFAVNVNSTIPGGVTTIDNIVGIADDGLNGPDEDPADNTHSDDTPIISAVDLVVTKSDGGVTATAGDVVTYTLSYSNQGNIGATGVVITETVPTNSSFDPVNSSGGWVESPVGSGNYVFSVGSLAAGGSGSVMFAVVVDDPLAPGVTLLNNTASISDDGANGADANPGDNLTADDTPLIAGPDLFIMKDDGESVVVAGQALTYTINYGNDGSQDATGVVITETLPAGLSFDPANSSAGWVETAAGSGLFTYNVGSLLAGSNGSITFAVIVDDPLASGVEQLVNNVSIADDGANGLDEDPSDNTATDTDTVDAAPNLYVVKDDSQTSVAPGDVLIYAINYGNDGSQDATGVVLTESLPMGTTFDPAGSSTGWAETAPGSGVFEYTIGGLAAGSHGTLTFAVTVNQPLAAGIDQLVNSVTIADDGTNGAEVDLSDNSDNDIDTVIAAPDLVVTKEDGGVNVTPAGIVTWTIHYANVGSQDATGVVLTEMLPANTTFDAAGSDAGWAETFPGSRIYTYAVGDLAAGQSASVLFAVRVDASIPSGVPAIDNTVTIADDGTNGGDEDPTNNSDSDSTPVVSAPDLVLTKSDAGFSAMPNDTVIYTLSYSNVGNVDATGVVITEQLPLGTTFAAVNSSTGWIETAPGSGLYTYAIGNLASGDAGTVTFAVTINDPLMAGLEAVENSAHISDDGANGPDANDLNNVATDDTPITAAPDLFVLKDDGNVIVAAGDTLIYTINYGNAGTQNASGVVLTETIPLGTMFDGANSDPGWTETSPGSGVYEFAVGSLLVNETRSLQFAVIVDDPLAPTIVQLLNAVTISDDGTSGPDENPADNSDSDIDVFDMAVDLSVVKDNGQIIATAGETLVYSIQYANNGSATATGVILTETLPQGTTFDSQASSAGWSETTPGSGTYTLSIGTLTAGETGSVEFAVVVADTWAAGIQQLLNEVTITDDSASGADLNPADNRYEEIDLLEVAPDLSLVKDDGNATVLAGGDIVYTLTYANHGQQEAVGVVITENLPANSTFNASLSSAGWTETSPGVYEFTIGSLAVGETGSVQFAVTAHDPVSAGATQITNSASISDDGTNGADLNIGDNIATDTTPLRTAPDYVIQKDDGLTQATPGQTITYTITVSNVGGSDGTGVVVMDSYPLGLMETVVADQGGIVDATTGTITWNLGDLAAGQTVTLTVTGQLIGAAPAGVDDFTNEVEVGDDGAGGPDPTPDNNQDDDTDMLIAAPDLTIEKTDHGSEGILGDTVIYDLIYRNQGNQDATGVVITETLPPGTSFDASNSSAGWIDLGGGNYEFVAGSVSVGEVRTIQFAIIVQDELQATLTIRNTTTIGDDGTNGADPTPNDNWATEETPLGTGVIEGNVFDDVDNDGVFSGSDAPLSGVTITLEGDDIFGNHYSLTTVTDANGHYEFTGLPTGVYRLTQQQPAGFVDGQDSTGSPGGLVSGNDEITINLMGGESAPANNFGEVAEPDANVVSKRAFLSSRFTIGYSDVAGSIDAAVGEQPHAPDAYVESAIESDDGTVQRTVGRGGARTFRVDETEADDVVPAPASQGYWRSFLSSRLFRSERE